MIIVSDSSPLISFAILGKLDLLNEIFEAILVPNAVYEEIAVSKKPFSDEIKLFLKGKVVSVKNRIAVNILEKEIDPGEAEAIVLALEKNIADILMDDPKGRKTAEMHGLIPIGTIGSLLQLKRINRLDKIKPLLDTLIRNKIRIGIPLYKMALELAQEEGQD